MKMILLVLGKDGSSSNRKQQRAPQQPHPRPRILIRQRVVRNGGSGGRR